VGFAIEQNENFATVYIKCILERKKERKKERSIIIIRKNEPKAFILYLLN
jgi:hypothetical protein